MFLVAQAGLFLMLFTRFWQRGAEASLVLQHPILPEPEAPRTYDIRPTAPAVPPASSPSLPATDPPSLDRPHHIDMMDNPDLLTPLYPAPLSPDDPIAPLAPAESVPDRSAPDPIPNPEPAPPSLDEPDPGVFHHDPKKPNP
jgi:hypothetical protein